jgi:type I restriction enzyme S subunit
MTEQTASKVPQIRFKGFDGEWEDKTLGDLGAFKNGMNFGKEAMGHGNPFVNLQNVFGQFEVDDKKLELAESSSVQRREYSLIKGDVLFIRSSVKPEGVGETALITKTLLDTTYSGFIIRYRPEVMMSHDFNRIVYRTTAVRRQILANASRSANTNINQTALKKIALKIPSFEEQTRVGEYFRELERLIELHQRKHDKLATLKKAMLQKMFPQPGATTPEIRFKGFAGDWEEKKLGELSSLITKGTTPLGKSGRGLVNFVKIENIDKLSGEIKITSKISETEHLNYLKRSQLKTGDILFSIAGTLGRVAVVHENLLPANTNQALAIIRLAGGDIGYITTYLKGRAVDDFVKKNPTVGAQPNLSLEQVGTLGVLLPPEREQQKIGTYFRTLDALISKHATQLQKLQQIKSACLARMFV